MPGDGARARTGGSDAAPCLRRRRRRGWQRRAHLAPIKLQLSCVCVCVNTQCLSFFFFFFFFSIERFDRIELKLMTTMRKGQQCGGDDLWPGVSVCECVWIYYPIIFRWMKSDRAVAWPTRWMAYVANIWYSSSIINH